MKPIKITPSWAFLGASTATPSVIGHATSVKRNTIHPSLGVRVTAVKMSTGRTLYVDERINTIEYDGSRL